MDDNSLNNIILPIQQTAEYDFSHVYPDVSQVTNFPKHNALIVTSTMDIQIHLKPKAVPTNLLHSNHETRYVIIDENFGIVLDDNSGYGFKTAAAAYKAFFYRNRDLSKDAEKEVRKNNAYKWLDENYTFESAMLVEYGIVKSKLQETGIDFTTTYLKKQLKKFNLKIEGFKPYDLYKAFLDRNFED